MSLQSRVVLPFGDGTYTFSLRCRELEQLEKLIGDPVADIALRVIGMRPAYKDIKHIILLGLEGGGTAATMAQALFDRYVDGVPLFQKDNPSSPAMVAARTMEAAWFGVSDLMEDEAEGKPDPESKEAPGNE